VAFSFHPEPPQALAVCRILLYGALFLVFYNRDFTLCARLGEFYWDPKSFAWILYPHHAPSMELVNWMQVVWKISLVAACVGLATRVSTTVACVFGIVLLQLPGNFGKFDQGMAQSSIALIVMALSCCGGTWSLDRLIAGTLGQSPLRFG
jgi:hypothetical protein